MARRTREIWRQVIGQYERSGKTQEAYAEERGIPVGTLRGWIHRLKREEEEQAGAILPVRVIGSRSPSASRSSNDGEAVEVMLVRFGSGAASELIVEVIDRLRRC
jgi:hypothetical protein